MYLFSGSFLAALHRHLRMTAAQVLGVNHKDTAESISMIKLIEWHWEEKRNGRVGFDDMYGDNARADLAVPSPAPMQ